MQIASLTKIIRATDLGKKIKIDKCATQQKLASHVGAWKSISLNCKSSNKVSRHLRQ